MISVDQADRKLRPMKMKSCAYYIGVTYRWVVSVAPNGLAACPHCSEPTTSTAWGTAPQGRGDDHQVGIMPPRQGHKSQQSHSTVTQSEQNGPGQQGEDKNPNILLDCSKVLPSSILWKFFPVPFSSSGINRKYSPLFKVLFQLLIPTGGMWKQRCPCLSQCGIPCALTSTFTPLH